MLLLTVCKAQLPVGKRLESLTAKDLDGDLLPPSYHGQQYATSEERRKLCFPLDNTDT